MCLNSSFCLRLLKDQILICVLCQSGEECLLVSEIRLHFRNCALVYYIIEPNCLEYYFPFIIVNKCNLRVLGE